MRFPRLIANWAVLASLVILVPGSNVVEEWQAIAIADLKIKELGYYRHPDYRAHERKTCWVVFVTNQGVPVFGGHHFIEIDKRTGMVVDVRGGK